jgi:hypothetical protein
MVTKDANAWREECNYIDRVAGKKGKVSEMGFHLETFITYCEMQRDVATKHGFHDTAQYIQHVIDDMKSIGGVAATCKASDGTRNNEGTTR